MYPSDFQLQKEIGAGSFANVYKGLLSLTATSSMIEKYKNEMTSKGESIYTVAVKVMKGICKNIHKCMHPTLFRR